jgi:hypothetical protein
METPPGRPRPARHLESLRHWPPHADRTTFHRLIPTTPPPMNFTESRKQTSEAPPRRKRSLAWLLWLLVFLAGASGGGFLYYKNEEEQKIRINERITELGRQGSLLVENRRWEEAARSFDEIESLAPDSEIAKQGRSNIKAGMNEENTQFIGYWSGQAIAELEAGRLDEAQAIPDAQGILGHLPKNIGRPRRTSPQGRHHRRTKTTRRPPMAGRHHRRSKSSCHFSG